MEEMNFRENKSTKRKKKKNEKTISKIQIAVIAVELILILAIVGGMIWFIRFGSPISDSDKMIHVKPGTEEESSETEEESETESESETADNIVPTDDTDDLIENPSDEQVDAYWGNSVFFGDSIMAGYGMFLDAYASTALSDPLVCAVVGYDLQQVQMGLGQTKHPTYQGSQHTIFDIAVQENPEHIVLSFGINDLGLHGPEAVVQDYMSVIAQLQALCPKAKIYVVSTTYVFSGRESGHRTNANIMALNSMMRSYCTENNLGFIDVCSYLSSSEGSLYSGYTADFYVHLNQNAYRTWLALFRRYAYTALSAKESPQDGIYVINRPAEAQVVYVPDYDKVISSMQEETTEETQTETAEETTTAPTETSVQTEPQTTAEETTTTAEPTTQTNPPEPETEAPVTETVPEETSPQTEAAPDENGDVQN